MDGVQDISSGPSIEDKGNGMALDLLWNALASTADDVEGEDVKANVLHIGMNDDGLRNVHNNVLRHI